MPRKRTGLFCLLMEPCYKASDPPPIGYVEKSEWAAVQLKAGNRQSPCATCHKWFFPVEKHHCKQARLEGM